LDQGEYFPNFDGNTREIREDLGWKGAPIPKDLLDRRVEITGPTDRKMVINAMNSGAKVFMADFEVGREREAEAEGAKVDWGIGHLAIMVKGKELKTFHPVQDANSPTWRNQIEGQLNLYDAIRGQIHYVNPVTKQEYSLKKETAG
jgi:malate synthase